MKNLDGRRTLIVEGNPDGHRLYYVSVLAAGVIQAGGKVHVATTEHATLSEEWMLHMTDVASDVMVEIVEDYTLESIGRLCNGIQADQVVIPDGDAFAFALSKGKRWVGRGKVTALVMREKGQPSKIPGAAPFKTVMKGALLLLANMAPRVEIRILKSSPWRGFSFLPTTRDPVTFSLPSSKNDEPTCLLPKDRFWVGVVGSIGQRKNLPVVAAAVAALNRADVGLAVAGRIDEGALEPAKRYLTQIQMNGGRVEVIDRLLDESEMDQILSELHCVVLAHSNEGPSGILGKAAAAGTSIVAAGALTLRSDCRHIGEGAEWVRLREDHLTEALARALRKPRPEPTVLASPTDFVSDLLGLGL